MDTEKCAALLCALEEGTLARAAEKLGYKVNSKAQSLRQGKDRAIAVLLPGMEDLRWAVMYEVFQSEFIRHGYSVRLYSTRSMETTEEELLAAALAEQVWWMPRHTIGQKPRNFRWCFSHGKAANLKM